MTTDIPQFRDTLEWHSPVVGNGSATNLHPTADCDDSKLLLNLSLQDRRQLARIADALERLISQKTPPEEKALDDKSQNQPLSTQEILDLKKTIEKRFDELQGQVQKCAVRDSTNVIKKFYTVKEVAERTSYSGWTIRDACNTGRIDGAEKGDDGKWRLSHETLEHLQNYGLPSKSVEK